MRILIAFERLSHMRQPFCNEGRYVNLRSRDIYPLKARSFPLDSHKSIPRAGGNRISETRSPVFMTGLLKHAGFRSAGAASLIPSCAGNPIWLIRHSRKGLVKGYMSPALRLSDADRHWRSFGSGLVIGRSLLDSIGIWQSMTEDGVHPADTHRIWKSSRKDGML